MTIFNYLEDIQRYDDHQMTESERQTFEKQLSEDAELAKELADYRKIGKLVSSFGNEIFNQYQQSEEDVLRQKLKLASADYHGDTMPIIMKPQKSYSKMWAIAASLLVLIGAGLYFLGNVSPNFEAIAEVSNEKEMENLGSLMRLNNDPSGITPSRNDYRKTVVDLITKNDLKLALDMLHASASPETDREDEDIYLSGLIYYKMNDWEAAIQELKIITNSGESIFGLMYHSEWLIALSYYNIKEYEQATQFAKKVLENKDKPLFQNEAEELLSLTKNKN